MKQRLAWAVSAAALGSGVLGLLAAFAPAFDMLNHFAPLWLAFALAAFALAKFWAHRRSALVAAAVGAACHAALLLPEAGAALGQGLAPPSPGDLTVAVFNIWGRNPAPERSGAFLASTGADIMVVLETRPENAVVLDAAGLPYRTSCQGRFFACSASILSRYPFLEEGRDLCAIAVAAVVITPQLGRVTIVGVHLSRPFPDALRQQLQMDCLSNEVAALGARGRVIVVGDFNATPWSFALRRMDAGLAGFERVTRAMPTWPARGARISRLSVPSPLAILPIDHAYLGPGLTAAGVQRGPAVGSDHLPVIVRVQTTVF